MSSMTIEPMEIDTSYMVHPATPGSSSTPHIGLDHNNLVVGKWKSGILGCMNGDLVPNCAMPTICPCVAVAQIVHRVGMYKYWTALAVFTVLLMVYAACTTCDALNWSRYFVVPMWGTTFLALLLVAYVRRNFRKQFQIPGSTFEDIACSCFFSCCVIGQMATHCEAYTPAQCTFGPKDTLPGYNRHA
ncbi:Aste57867_1027 [Aphanomyces stellatus]|uniref:Aste57867_1027 protein n=1 Tax=Aphanomyces stellatus TaxID=120398 RepID=A0A485K5D6_9STRA|nr:hypothetical protein As57867_001026 [Aphanomyces stellatus]VFT78249.1 Aste57867_1027 [Aphanomyces stellatus]